jgi:putative transposase
LPYRHAVNTVWREATPRVSMNYISPNSPAYYLTSVAKNRLPVFRNDTMKSIAGRALDEARSSGKFLISAYVIMPDHLHVISDGERKPAVVLRFINGIISRRVIDYLKQKGHESSLEKLRRESSARGHEYSLWDHHPNVRLLTSEGMFMQRVHYTHQNPVRLGLVDRAEDYLYSSARIWNKNPLEDEPLNIDIREIKWRG